MSGAGRLSRWLWATLLPDGGCPHTGHVNIAVASGDKGTLAQCYEGILPGCAGREDSGMGKGACVITGHTCRSMRSSLSKQGCLGGKHCGSCGKLCPWTRWSDDGARYIHTHGSARWLCHLLDVSPCQRKNPLRSQLPQWYNREDVPCPLRFRTKYTGRNCPEESMCSTHSGYRKVRLEIKPEVLFLRGSQEDARKNTRRTVNNENTSEASQEEHPSRGPLSGLMSRRAHPVRPELLS